MEKGIVIPPSVDPAASENFYRLVGQAPETEAAWVQRQAALGSWRSDPRFEAYWPSIDHMLADDYSSFKRRAAALADLAGDLVGYDFDAWRAQREYDLLHAKDHLLPFLSRSSTFSRRSDKLQSVSAGSGLIMHNLPTIWREVSSWPAEQRLELATRLLQSLEQEAKPGRISPERQEALRQLIGIWKTAQPPNDEQVQQLLEQERMKKYG